MVQQVLPRGEGWSHPIKNYQITAFYEEEKSGNVPEPIVESNRNHYAVTLTSKFSVESFSIRCGNAYEPTLPTVLSNLHNHARYGDYDSYQEFISCNKGFLTSYKDGGRAFYAYCNDVRKKLIRLFNHTEPTGE